MKKILKSSLLLLPFYILMLVSQPSYAQGPNPGCDPVGPVDCNCAEWATDPICPIDGGVVALLAAGLGYGIIKARGTGRKKNIQNS